MYFNAPESLTRNHKLIIVISVIKLIQVCYKSIEDKK